MTAKKLLLLGTTATVVISTTAFAQNVVTRFGSLTVDAENVLLFKGRPVKPDVVGNNSLSLIRKFQLGSKTDIVLVQDNGGTGCPAQYHFVSVSASGAKATRAFGTCSDLVEVVHRKDTISVSMPGFVGYGATQAEMDKAVEETHTFTFKNGKVTEVVRRVRGKQTSSTRR